MQDTIEQALINRLKKGDGEALEEMYDLYAPVLLSISMRYMSCREDAEDVVFRSHRSKDFLIRESPHAQQV